MGDKTTIEWTDATWNPVTGCTKVSQGCKYCYAEREWPRMTKLVPAYAGREFTDVQTHGDRLDQPLRWKKPRMIFVNSMSDLFHEDVPFEFIDKVFAVMTFAPRHVFQVLTKRPDRMREYMMRNRNTFALRELAPSARGIAMAEDEVIPLCKNIWLGVSVEDQSAADERIPLLLDTPAAVRWVSAEPLLGPVDLSRWVYDREAAIMNAMSSPPAYNREQAMSGIPRPLDWVVVGGESGPGARPMHPDWARRLLYQCVVAGVPYLFKQWGEWGSVWGAATHLLYQDGTCISGTHDHPDAWKHKTAETIARVGKKSAGRLLDGVAHDGYPKGGAS